MNPYAAYQNDVPIATTRIDLLLALYDGAIDRLQTATEMLRANDPDGARSRIAKCQLMIAELSASVRIDAAPAVCANILRLYEFVADRLARGDLGALDDARKVLENLRAGFRSIRAEALELERAGKVPPMDDAQAVSTLA